MYSWYLYIGYKSMMHRSDCRVLIPANWISHIPIRWTNNSNQLAVGSVGERLICQEAPISIS
jgi:hypothetical protein